MGVPVSDFNEFRKKLKAVQDKSVIFGFLLFDSRPSQEVINHFTQEHADWIDELARNAGIYFFFPFQHDAQTFNNPSVKIANIFKLSASRLPCIVLFSPPGKDGKLNSDHMVYIPLKPKNFNEINVFEPIMIDLFDLIRESIAQEKKTGLVLQHIHEELSGLRRKKNQRALANYIRKGAHLLFKQLPKNFPEIMAKVI